MIETQRPLSEGWWLDRLSKKLADRQGHYDLLQRYYDNEPTLNVPSTKAVRQAYQRLMTMARTNFAELIVEAVRERMAPLAFRTGADSDEGGDAEAWRVWQANQLDADSSLVHRAQLTMGAAYVCIGGVDPEVDAPLITVEDPREVITECDPRRRRRVVAALKTFYDDLYGRRRAYLYLPGRVVQAVGPEGERTYTGSVTTWDWLGEEALPAQVVPVVPFLNQPDLRGTPCGEFERHIPLLDRINYTVLNRLEVMTLQAFKQRAVKGVPDRDEHGNEVDYDNIFASGPDALWVLPATAEMWESGAVDLNPIRQAVRDDIQDLAAGTRSPMYYLNPEGANGSAEGASLAREGLVFKTHDRLAQTGESWEQVLAMSFLFAGDTVRARRRDMQIVWASPERFSLAERFDAASKAKAAGVPWRQTMSSVLQYSPQEIARMEAERASDVFAALLQQPAPQPQLLPAVEQPVNGAS